MSNLENRKFILVVGLVTFYIGCASSMDSAKDKANMPPSVSATQELKSTSVAIAEDGWVVNTRDPSNGKDANAISEASRYMKKYSGKANARSIELKSSSYMESTCRQTIKKVNGRALIESAYTSLGVDLKPEAMSALSAKITQEDLKKIEVTNCQPTSPEKTFSECECALSYKVEGGKKAMMEKIVPQNK